MVRVKVRIQRNPDNQRLDCVLDSDPSKFIVRGMPLHNLLLLINHPRAGKTSMRIEVLDDINLRGYYVTTIESRQ